MKGGWMNARNIQKSNLSHLIDYLTTSHQVLGPRKGVKTPVFGEVWDARELALEYTTSILPPKKFFMPTKETLLTFDLQTQQARVPSPAAQKRVLLGVHPCDMAGILMLDWAFTEGEPESNWIERRKATTVFGITQIPDEQCFSNAVGSNDPEKGYDGFFFDNGEYYTVVAYTQ
jgi:sulfhydrogenase subunit beta (sulfur reductase)